MAITTYKCVDYFWQALVSTVRLISGSVLKQLVGSESLLGQFRIKKKFLDEVHLFLPELMTIQNIIVESIN